MAEGPPQRAGPGDQRGQGLAPSRVLGRPPSPGGEHHSFLLSPYFLASRGWLQAREGSKGMGLKVHTAPRVGAH